MIKSFKHKGLERFFLRGTKAGIKPEHEKRLRLVLARLHASKFPGDMNLPGLRFHKLTGDLKEYWSVSVSGNWRVVFKFSDGEAIDVDYLDYH